MKRSFYPFAPQFRSGYYGDTTTLCCYSSVGGTRARLLFFGNFGRGSLGKHVQHQFEVGHIVAQILGFQTFVLLVLPRRHARPTLRDNVGQDRVLLPPFHTAAFPFIGLLLAYLDGFQPLVDPTLRIALAVVVFQHAVDAYFGIVFLLQPLAAQRGQPQFERLGLGRLDGLHETEKLLRIYDIRHAHLTVGGGHFQRTIIFGRIGERICPAGDK